jgi:hypothetical protein
MKYMNGDSKSFMGLVKPVAVAGVFLGSIAFSLLLTFSNPDVVRSRLHLSPRQGADKAVNSEIAAMAPMATNSLPLKTSNPIGLALKSPSANQF